ncbi:MAG: hypothetical protein ACRDSJ_00750 [Rubrobacteraceae bacterium]
MRSVGETAGGRIVSSPRLAEALSKISAGAAERDAHPVFPHGPFEKLAGLGVLALPVPDAERSRRSSFAEEWEVLRAVAGAEGSVGRVLDGHFNGVERLSLLAPEPLRSEELEAVEAGELLLGVWGADPIPGEGEPAKLVRQGGEPFVEGTKTFCSGATGVDRALVLVRGAEPGPPHLVYVDAFDGVEVDEDWFRGSGMKASCSYRVVFHGAPALAVLGEPGEIAREPYFGRDAVRTAVTWVGVADAVVESALETLAARSGARDPDDIESLAAGKMLTAQATMDRWLEHATRLADEASPHTPMTPFSVKLREAVASACREVMDEAARACGSRPFAAGDALDRASRDLQIFLLQHRLEPLLAKVGRRAIEERKR